MATQIVIPEVGESVTSGVIAAWTVEDGAYVNRDDTVIELETDKITMEVPAPASGVIKRQASEGDEVEVGAVVGEIDESAEKPAAGGAKKQATAQAKAGGEEQAGGGTATEAPPKQEDPKQEDPKQEEKQQKEKPPKDAEQAAPGQKAQAGGEKPKEEPTPAPAAGTANGDRTALQTGAPTDGEVRATPLARKLAEDNAIDLRGLTGTGAGGRVREQDVLAAIQHAPPRAPAEPEAPAGPSRKTSVEKMSQLRQRVASRLVEAQQTAAMLTTFNEVDMGAVMALRKKHKEAFGEKHGINLGFMSFFTKACVGAMHAFPKINSYIVASEDGKPAIQGHEYCDIAIAVSSPKGLVVPVIRNAESLSFAEIEKQIKDFGTRAQQGKLGLDEMQGGTFTITNGGVFGSLMSTPILNPPQSAILGMHTIKNRPAEHPEKPGEIALRPLMYLALSYDHRIVDGAEAVQFLVHVKNAIEDPARLMLDL